jgi:hypothetical protein
MGQKEAKIKEDRGDDEESTELNDGRGKKRKNKKDVDAAARQGVKRKEAR